MNAQRKVYRHAALQRLFAPQSVAIFGVSSKEGGFGSRTLKLLETGGYQGRVYAINPKYGRVQDRPCYPAIDALPELPDCVVVALPHERVVPVIEDCARLGVGGAIVYSSGFRETGRRDRATEQSRLVQIAQTSDIRILGPNCIGVQNFALGFHASFLTAGEGPLPTPRAGAIGLAGQSGALGFALTQAVEHGISFSHLLTCGNACDVDVADEVSYLAQDPSCKAIACVFEGMSEPTRLLEAAELARAADKPLVVYKMAIGSSGTAAALSHTGSLAGSTAAYHAAFRRVGAVAVDDFEALLEAASFFAKAGHVTAPGVAVVAGSGGGCIMAADKAEKYGVPLPQPSAATHEILVRAVPEFGSARNPCDITAQVISMPDSLHDCVDALLGDPQFGTLVIAQTVVYAEAGDRLAIYSAAARAVGKIACVVWLSEWLEGPGAREIEVDEHVALFRSMDRCFATFAAWHERERRLASLPRATQRVSSPGSKARASALVAAYANQALTEYESRQLLEIYGVPTVTSVLVHGPREAVRAAADIGYPVVLKVESPDIVHKTDAGVVCLNLASESALQTAYAAIMDHAARIVPAPHIHGVLVQPMLPAGAEIMVGAKIDPLFGPLIVVGTGGVFVELFKDLVVDLAPVNHEEALSMLHRLQGRALLEGFRGSDPVDTHLLADVVCRLSEMASDLRHCIAEIDINPVICSGSGVVAADALIVQRPHEEAQLDEATRLTT